MNLFTSSYKTIYVELFIIYIIYNCFIVLLWCY